MAYIDIETARYTARWIPTYHPEQARVDELPKNPLAIFLECMSSNLASTLFMLSGSRLLEWPMKYASPPWQHYDHYGKIHEYARRNGTALIAAEPETEVKKNWRNWGMLDSTDQEDPIGKDEYDEFMKLREIYDKPGRIKLDSDEFRFLEKVRDKLLLGLDQECRETNLRDLMMADTIDLVTHRLCVNSRFSGVDSVRQGNSEPEAVIYAGMFHTGLIRALDMEPTVRQEKIKCFNNEEGFYKVAPDNFEIIPLARYNKLSILGGTISLPVGYWTYNRFIRGHLLYQSFHPKETN